LFSRPIKFPVSVKDPEASDEKAKIKDKNSLDFGFCQLRIIALFVQIRHNRGGIPYLLGKKISPGEPP
jgi:hypothetical protein